MGLIQPLHASGVLCPLDDDFFDLLYLYFFLGDVCAKRRKNTQRLLCHLHLVSVIMLVVMLTGCWPLFSILNGQILKHYLSSHVNRKPEKGISQNVRLKEMHSLWDEFPCLH